MDIQDHIKTSLSGHENHGISHWVHLCHKCGWPFPNPHPSAKHRRAHKRICGTLEGYKLVDSGEHVNSPVSDDEHGSDEDLQTPSPKIEKRSTNEISSGGVGERSNRSEDEVFSDAVTEFLDSGFSPGNEERLVGSLKASDMNVEKVVKGDQGTDQQLKVDATAGIVQLPNIPTESSQMQDSKVLETATNLLGSAMPSEDIVFSCNSDSVVISNNTTEEHAVGLSSVNVSAGDLSPIKSETLRDVPKEHVKADVGDHGMQYSTSQETEVKGNEERNVDKVLLDVAVTPCNTVSEASEVACKLQEMDLKASDSVTVDQIVESKEEQIHELEPVMCLHNLTMEVKSFEQMEAVVNTAQIESDSVQDMDVGSCGDSLAGCDTKGEGNVNFHVLSVANDIPVIDHAEIMIEDFKDHKAVKSNLPVTIDSGEVIEPVVDNNRDTVYEENCSSFQSSKSGKSVHISGEADTSEIKVSSKDLGSNTIEAPGGTTRSGTQEIQTYSLFEEQKPHNFHNDLSQEILPVPTKLSDVIPMAISVDENFGHTTNFSGGDNADDHEKNKTEKCDTDGKDSEDIVEEEPSTNRKTTSESADDLSVLIANQTTNLLGAGNSGVHEKDVIGISDLARNESIVVAIEEKLEMSSEMTLESACHLSEPKVTADGGIDKVMNLQETESTTYFVSHSSETEHNSSYLASMAPIHSDSQNCQDEDCQEAIKETNLSGKNEVLAESVCSACKDTESNPDGGAEVLQKISETPQEKLPLNSEFNEKSSATVEESHFRNVGLGTSGISTEYLQEEGAEKLTKQPFEVSAADVSVDSSSQTDSLEGNWGSVSVLSTQSGAPSATDAEVSPSNASQAAAQLEKVNLQKPQTTYEGHHSNKSDVFEAPSFMTLVEPGDRVNQKAASLAVQTSEVTQQPRSEALQAGWFPSLTNVINESKGRKKNEQIISKVTNWTTGKQHTPLKSLMGEANLESKPKSPNPKQTPTVMKKDENTTVNNDASATTVTSLRPEAPNDQVAKKEAAGREWKSPASCPTDNKKDKRKVKGRPYWVQFVCCSSVN